MSDTSVQNSASVRRAGSDCAAAACGAPSGVAAVETVRTGEAPVTTRSTTAAAINRRERNTIIGPPMPVTSLLIEDWPPGPFNNTRRCVAACGVLRLREEVTQDVKVDRRGEAERVDAVHHSAMSLDESAPVLEAALPLDRGKDQAAEKSGDAQKDGYAEGLPRRERRQPEHRGAERAGGDHAARETLDCLLRTQRRRDRPFSQQLAPHVLQH